ncbi:MAG: hypothetical protein QM541_15385 [Flavobacterium sp.]|nr:hypothetical protein [Flavobacterium sp.]
MKQLRYTVLLMFALVVMLCVCNIATAQDTATALVPLKKLKLSLKPTTDFDQRFSFINKEDVNIWGYRVGVIVNDKFKVGIGGYFLNQDTTIVRTDRFGNPTSKLQRKLYFGTVYYEPYLFRKPLVEMSLVFEIGYGKAVLDSANSKRNGNRPPTIVSVEDKQDFVPAGAGISFNFKVPDIKGLHFLTYVGINAMTGLRKTIFESDLKNNFDGWYWSIGGAIFLDKLLADMKAKKAHKKATLASLP